MRAQNMNTAAAVAAVTHDVSSQGECVDRILTIVHQLQNEIKERDARQERAVSQAKEITRKEVSQALLNRFELEISQLHVNFDQRFREVVAQTEGLEQLKIESAVAVAKETLRQEVLEEAKNQHQSKLNEMEQLIAQLKEC